MQEEYYIEYDTSNSYILNQRTDRISSVSDTSAVNMTYSITMDNLTPGTVYYLRVVAVFDTLSKRRSDVAYFRTYETGRWMLQ